MLDHMGVSQTQVRLLEDLSRAAPRPVKQHAVDICSPE